MPDAGENEADDGKRFSERSRQIGRHKENARRFHIYRPSAISADCSQLTFPATRRIHTSRSPVLNADNFSAKRSDGCLENQTDLDWYDGGSDQTIQPVLPEQIRYAQAGQEYHSQSLGRQLHSVVTSQGFADVIGGSTCGLEVARGPQGVPQPEGQLKLLEIQSSPKRGSSDSIRLTKSFAKVYKVRQRSVVVDTLSVWHERLQGFDEEDVGQVQSKRVNHG